MAHEEIIWETLKTYVTSSNNLQKKNLYYLTCSFGQLQKPFYNTVGFLYLIHKYGHHICLSHDMPMVTTSSYVIILPSVIFYMNFEQYIVIYTCF